MNDEVDLAFAAELAAADLRELEFRRAVERVCGVVDPVELRAFRDGVPGLLPPLPGAHLDRPIRAAQGRLAALTLEMRRVREGRARRVAGMLDRGGRA